MASISSLRQKEEGKKNTFSGGFDMIIVSAKFTAKPGMKEKIAEVSRKAVELTRKEKGNISYTLLSSTEDDTFMYFEEWDSIESLKAHLKTEHIAAARDARKDMITGPVTVRVFEAKEVSLQG